MTTKDILSSEVKTDIGNLIHRMIQVHSIYLHAVDEGKSKKADRWSKYMDGLKDELNDRYGIEVQ